MNKDTHFNGQPKTAGSLMAQPPADYRLHDNNPFFQPHIQGRGKASQDGEEGRHKSAHQHPRLPDKVKRIG